MRRRPPYPPSTLHTVCPSHAHRDQLQDAGGGGHPALPRHPAGPLLCHHRLQPGRQVCVCVPVCLSVSPAQSSPLRTPHSLTRPASHPRPPVQPAGAAVAAGAGAAGGPAGGQDHHHLAAGPPVWADPRRVCAHRLCAQPGWRVCVCAAGAGQPAQRAARRPQPPPHHCRGTVHGPHAAPHRRGRSHRQSAQPAWRRRCARWARGHAGHMGGLHGIDALAALHALAALQRARHHSIPPFLPPRPPTRPP